MTLEEDFKSAQSRIRTLSSTPTNARLLELYGLFKQGTEGDVTGARPGALNFRARAKYDAWSSRKGLSRDQAQKQYIELVEQLLAG